MLPRYNIGSFSAAKKNEILVSVETGGYNKAGVFLKDQSYVDDQVMDDVFVSLDPADDDGDGTLELHGKQRISFITHANTVAWAESVWSVIGGQLRLVSEKIEAYNP